MYSVLSVNLRTQLRACCIFTSALSAPFSLQYSTTCHTANALLVVRVEYPYPSPYPSPASATLDTRVTRYVSMSGVELPWRRRIKSDIRRKKGGRKEASNEGRRESFSFTFAVSTVLYCSRAVGVLVPPLLNAPNECHAQTRNPESKKVRSSSKKTGGTCTD